MSIRYTPVSVVFSLGTGEYSHIMRRRYGIGSSLLCSPSKLCGSILGSVYMGLRRMMLSNENSHREPELIICQ